ncbi:MAG: S-layer homology domain-containing protein, partial [Candidatus Margulisbacteria bacterium]|nr:S-layer homology domain-containing protein [Candidatus Margulisiibacteriota bacterium]
MRKYFKVFLVLFLLLNVLLFSGRVAFSQEVKLASDITRLAVGARPLGMGKMFVGLSDDISAMYLNPAGLAGIEGNQALTMSASFVNMVNYLTLAAATPAQFGSIGVGYSGASLGFNTPVLNLVEIATGEYRVIPSTTESVSYNYNNYALAFSYANTILWPELSFGSTLKLFTENISGTSSGNGQGYDLDLGLLYKQSDTLSLGLTGKNVMPASLGGKMTWSTGLTESIPSTLIVGANMKIPSGAGINLGLDYELQPTQPTIPPFWHLGLEWWMTEAFAIRGGIDQDVVGTGTGTALSVTSNPTAGLSLLAFGTRFDYAFHRYNDIASNDTHYFSLALVGGKRIPLTVISPEDKLITHESTVIVIGKVDDPNIKIVSINDQDVQINNSKFETEVSLMLGKNTIWVAGLNHDRKVVESIRLRVLRLQKFSDVPDDYWANNDIEYLGTLNIMPGFSDGTFQPEKTTQRVDYLMRLLNVGKVPPATELSPFPFTDVETSEKIAPYVKSGFDNSLVIGYPDKTFRPWRWLNRVEGAIMTVRFSKLSLSTVLESPYLDVPARHWA